MPDTAQTTVNDLGPYWMPFTANRQFKAAPRMLVLCPYGYGDTVFRAVGEDDIFRTMALVEKDFNVDKARVYLTGVSNGGLGAYEVMEADDLDEEEEDEG